jgi:hypothetical protein
MTWQLSQASLVAGWVGALPGATVLLWQVTQASVTVE